MDDNQKVTVTVSGLHGTGKTTVATLIRNTLRAQNFDVRLRLTNNEMVPCPTTLRQRAHSLVDHGLTVEVIEVDEKP